MMPIRLPLIVAALTSLLPALSPATAEEATETVSLIEGPVHVTQSIGAYDANGMTATTLVGDGPGQVRIPTQLAQEISFANKAEALAEGRRQVRWQPPYLLVESAANWKQDIYNMVWVFKLVDGQPKRLGLLGGGDLAMASPGRFLSLYNKAAIWQSMVFQCTACKSRLRIVLEDKGDELRPDLEATWRINQSILRENEKAVRDELATGIPEDEDAAWRWRMTIEGALIENAVLAAYCGRTEDLHRLTAIAEKHLDQASRTEFERSLQHVVPGEAPEHWSAVWDEE